MRFVGAIVALGLVLVYAIGSGALLDTSSPWYRELVTPSWQPPSWVFGLAWTWNFTALAAVGIALALGSPRSWVWLGMFAVTIALALTWSALFSVTHALVPAAIALTLAAVGTLPLVWLAWSWSAWAGAVLVPYQVWLVIASSLSWGYAALNRG